MVLIKVTPEMLEQAAKTVSNTRHFLEYLHNAYTIKLKISLLSGMERVENNFIRDLMKQNQKCLLF